MAAAGAMEEPLLSASSPRCSTSIGFKSAFGSQKFTRHLSGVLAEDLDVDETQCSAFSHKNPVLHSRRGHAASKGSPTTSPLCSPSVRFVRQISDSPLLLPHGHFKAEPIALDAPTSQPSIGTIRQPSFELMQPVAMPQPPEEKPLPTGVAAVAHGSIYGMINFIVCVPTLISYAAIVFRVPAFGPDMPTLTKLFFLSSAVHQLIFTCLSTLPFAVGQVQDVGLIFLSQIVTHCYRLALSDGHSYPEVLATVLIACAGSTVITGALVWLVGYLRLSGYVQLLPLPVVGGYLGYIGYFCLAAGASLGTGLTIEGFATWSKFLVWDPLLWSKLGSSLAFAWLMFYVAYNVKHVAALPSILVATPILFFVALWGLGISVEEARAAGWIPYPDPDPAAGWACFSLYNEFQGIAWPAMPHMIPKVVGLVCVVCFGSVLDIAAIQTEQPKPLDFDEELRTVGLSNVASGCSCGFTGSYIFSQTIFSQRQRVNSKSNGWVVAGGEFLLFLMPVDVLQFFPGFYIGGTMAFFGFDIMLDWLVHSKKKVSKAEYGLLLLTFFFVMFLGVIEGCAAGVAGSAVEFMFVYGRTRAVEIRKGVQSTSMRSFDERAVLLEVRHQIISLELKGYLFFGAALQVSDRLLKELGDLGARWVVVDFTQVAGVDSTSARALAKLVAALRADDVRVVFCGVQLKAQTYRLIAENGALPSDYDMLCGLAGVTDNMDEALAWCERGALREAGVHRVGSTVQLALTMPDGTRRKPEEGDALTVLLREYVHPVHLASAEVPTKPAASESTKAVDEQLRALAGFMRQERFRPGAPLFTAGSPCDGFWLIFEGTAISDPSPEENSHQAPQYGTFTFEAGAMLGEVDFFLQAPYSYTARAGQQGCAAAVLTRSVLDKMEREDPRLALVAQRVALRSVCLLTLATAGIFARTGAGG